MTAVTEAAHDAVAPATAGRSPWPRRLGLVALVAVVASPVVVASLAIAGEPWWPMGEHIYDAGDDYDMLLTIAVHNGGSWTDAYARCDQGSSTARLLGSWDAITPEERAFVDDMRLRQLDDPGSISAEERARFDRLELEGTRVGVFEGPQVCGLTVSLLPEDDDCGPPSRRADRSRRQGHRGLCLSPRTRRGGCGRASRRSGRR